MQAKTFTVPFYESFMDHLIVYVKKNYLDQGRDLSRLAIVFGGKRPALFVRRGLAQCQQKSFYPPRFFTIDEFVATVLQKKFTCQSMDDLDHCYLLYQLAQEVAPEVLKGRESFAQFLPWTREILSFIDQLDLEVVSNDRLTHVEENAQIGYAVPNDINRLLQSIVKLRQAYHAALEKKQVFSRGWQYHQAAAVIGEVAFEEFDQILFANFFYFNRSEAVLVKHLFKQDKATVMFQGDQKYWPVLTRMSKLLEQPIQEDLSGGKYQAPQIQLYAAFDAHAQIGLLQEVLKNIPREALAKTVIVLPNADQIIPLLSVITQTVKEFNISMGYPLKRSSLVTLLSLLFKAQLSRKGGQYYAKDYLKVLQHPFIKNLRLDGQAIATRVLVHRVEEILTGQQSTSISGSLFFDLKALEDLPVWLEKEAESVVMLQRLHQLLFVDWQGIQTFECFADILSALLDTLIEHSFLENYPLNINIATKMLSILESIRVLSFKEEIFAQEELFRIFESKISHEIVAFVGSPLKGLQILGLQETRSLNFENVIMLDVNEGVLPSLRIYEPLIPREVMVGLNLDRLEMEEEIQRYQFMRLIASARQVHLIYQEGKDKERSRFIEALIWEEQKKENTLNVLPVTRPSYQVKITRSVRRVKKTAAMIETLVRHTFSASSVNLYLRNPMDFYYRYVLGLREREDLLDEPQARQIGTFVHVLLEELFTPFVGTCPVIDQEFRQRAANLFEVQFANSFGRSMKSDAFLLRSVMVERLNRFLDHEQTAEDRQIEKILYLEQRFDDVIPLSAGDVRFGYVVDRIDLMPDGTIMILDYKTGSADVMPRAIEKIQHMTLSRESIFESVKSFQIPLYYYYLDKKYPDQPINAALYSLRTMEAHRFIDKRMLTDRPIILKAFNRTLDFIMAEILDPAVDFIDDPLA